MNPLSWSLLAFLLDLIVLVEARKTTKGYDTSFVYLSAKNLATGEEVKVCANYLQFRVKRIAADAESANPVGLSFWRHRFNETKICPLPQQPVLYNGSAVPLDYRIYDDGTNCTRQFIEGSAAFKNATQFQVDKLKYYGADCAILLVEKGKLFITKWHDYLFSDFYDPYVNVSDAIPTFFLYAHVFQQKILGLVNGTDISQMQLRFHRPSPYPFDFSMLIMWLIAVGCVAGGGAWAFFRHRAGKDITVVSTSPACSSHSSPSDSNAELRKKRLAFYSSFLAIAVLMVILVGILMIGFFFRPILVAFFNVMLVLFGSISVYGCIMALFSNCNLCECCSTRLCAGIQHPWLPKGRPNLLQLVVFICSFVLCLIWFLERRTPYAFIVLDFINVTLCLHILKSLRLPNVMWITVLMICMFVYDAVMVFVTPYLTSSGCSVMLEVATGIGCSSDGNDGYPMPPVDAALPEKFPMLMQVPRFDPMTSCVDLEVEKNFQMTILGLGDIIIPGYLVTHCFTMNGFSERSRIMYGILCSFGYGAGLIVTFFALSIMSMAQPALIYLVPCTLIPIFVMACIRGHFRLMWHGAEESSESTASLQRNSGEESGPLSNDVVEEAETFRQSK